MKGKAEALNQIQDAFNSEPLSTSKELEAYYLNTALARTGKYIFINCLSAILGAERQRNCINSCRE